MNNISFSNNMRGYHGDNSSLEQEAVPTLSSIILHLGEQIETCKELSSQIDAIYELKAYKELYDVKIYLKMVYDLLNKVNKE